jgi:hypothetical protein
MNSRHSDFCRWTSFGLILLLTIVLCPNAPAQRPLRNNRPPVPGPTQENKPSLLSIRVDGDRITAKISDCPLQDVLREFADRTGVIFEVRSHDNPLVSVHLDHIPMQESIQRITSGSNTIFIFDKNNPQRISMVRLFPRTSPPVQPGIIYLGTGAVIKTNEDVETPEQALKVLAESTNPETREKAVEVLVNTKGDDVVKGLMNYISDPAPEIRSAVIEGLAALGAHEALTEILKKLRDANSGVRQSATTAVALLGDAKNIKDLKPLATDKDPSVAAAAELAIRKLSAAEKK